MSDDNPLYESPRDFWTPTTQIDDYYCDGQSVVPDGSGFVVACSCGNFAREVASTEAGLELARQHTSRVAISA